MDNLFTKYRALIALFLNLHYLILRPQNFEILCRRALSTLQRSCSWLLGLYFSHIFLFFSPSSSSSLLLHFWFSIGVRRAKLCRGSHVRPVEDIARGGYLPQPQRGEPTAQLKVRRLSQDLLLWRLSDGHEVLLVWDDGPLLLPLLIHRGDADMYLRCLGADIPPPDGCVHPKNSDIPSQLHWRQNEREHSSLRVSSRMKKSLKSNW